MLPTITTTALHALSQSAVEVQTALLEHTGEHYEIADLNGVLARWLEGSIEQLCEEACELCVTGDHTYGSFNRDEFEERLRRVSAVNVWDQQAEVVQEARDQAAMALNRAA